MNGHAREGEDSPDVQQDDRLRTVATITHSRAAPMLSCKRGDGERVRNGEFRMKRGYVGDGAMVILTLERVKRGSKGCALLAPRGRARGVAGRVSRDLDVAAAQSLFVVAPVEHSCGLCVIQVEVMKFITSTEARACSQRAAHSCQNRTALKIAFRVNDLDLWYQALSRSFVADHS